MDNTNPKQPSLGHMQLVVSYLQYENSAYWWRFAIMIAIQAALLSVMSTKLPFSSAETAKVGIFCAIFGFTVAALSLWMMRASRGWADRWHRIIEEKLEPLVFEFSVFRESPKRHVRTLAEVLMALFGVAWIVTLVVAIMFLSCRCLAAS